MSGYTSVVDAAPPFVPGTFDAQDVRLATLLNARPGLYASGDFAVSQRAAGANMSVDIAAGRAIVDPGDVSRQGLYLPWMGSTYNTSSNGGYTWTAADATNPRIDLLCIDVRDTDFSGAYTGFKFRIVDGTPNASATHQLETAYWPAIPTGCLPLAAIRVPATATTLTTANITNLNAIGGHRAAYNSTATAETTTSSSFARLATPDFVCVYVPNLATRVRFGYTSHSKISVASGTQTAALFINGTQLNSANATNGAPSTALSASVTSLGTVYSRMVTPTLLGQAWSAGSGSDVSDAVMAGDGSPQADPGHVEILGFQAIGWFVFEVKYKTSANTLTIRNRFMTAEVIG